MYRVLSTYTSPSWRIRSNEDLPTGRLGSLFIVSAFGMALKSGGHFLSILRGETGLGKREAV
jgi:hypothetical protein